MIFFVLFIGMVGFILGKSLGYGSSFILPALLFSVLGSFFSYYYSDRMVLAMSHAYPARKDKDSEIIGIVEKLAKADHLPTPKVYISDEMAPNAFATGRDPEHASVCITSGLLQSLTMTEIEAVLAHEMSHIKNFDTRLMMIVSVLVGFIAFLSDWFIRTIIWGGSKNRDEDRSGGTILFLVGIILALLSPIIATLVQLAVSRRREFLADASGAMLTSKPLALASALSKIAADKRPLRTATNATAHLFIENPFKGKDTLVWFSSLFNTHPPTEERIRILKEMGK
jgi:heat shock protein HtpX